MPDCPEHPDSLSRENAEAFAIQFEKAYVTRNILDANERVTYVTVGHPVGEWAEPAVTETGDGFVVRFGAQVRYGQKKPGTTDVNHVDDPYHTANYFVTGDTVLRAKSGRKDPVDPREDGSRVQCPPD